MSVRQLLAEMDSRELAEWMAFAGIEGLGEVRADFRAGQICALLANIHRKEDVPPLSPADFMPSLRPDGEAQPGGDADGRDDQGALLRPDPEAQSRLIMLAVFGKST